MDDKVFRVIEGTNICVTRDGNLIWNKKTGKIYKQYSSKKYCRYSMVGIHEFGHTSEYVHVLVIKAWAPETFYPGREIHHISGDVTDNSIDNLICLDKEVHQRVHKLLRSKKNIDKELIKILKAA